MKRILFIMAIAFLAACGNKKDPKAELADLKKQRTELDAKILKLEETLGASDTTKAVAKDVDVMDVAESNFKNYLEVQGKIDAEENILVTSEAQGVVTAVYAKIGQNVRKGQVLAQIDDKVLRQNIAELQTQLTLATSLYNRQKNLWDQKIGTEVQFISAKTQKEAAENRIATLRSQIAMYKIKSPINGTIDAMDLKVGDAVMPGLSSIRVINASNLKAKAQVAETYAGRVNQGDQVNVVFPDVPDSLMTKINFASKTIDPASRSFEVQINLPSNKKYRPNMLAVLKIVDYQNPKALVIPISAVQKSESGEFVYVAVNGIAKKTDIKTGKSYEGKVEVLSGLKVGDKLITAGAQNLNADDAVKF
ncbi:efflux RND transporter periplasmic adaptor subunit [Pedobacter cryotolerans]|uniref:Efflux RND transporter periplasmic adaptor subunit n=1 Tax=Pedobacter cryotolerans TaxID=2571270 RepID=A0A4U1C3A8_9SPHI|nr:efflux RND transporter periplasmic adaptor subunit [Pedobacter cryotolerans]TKB99591.1 efflux RND transporter periplasmic adaptor subunit [Pedobacter cryotolerans]